jgi:hypothetical protein
LIVMYRAVATTALDERDRVIGAILIGEALIASCDHARTIGIAGTTEGWRAIQSAHDDFPEIWRHFDRARRVLAQRGVNVAGYDELRPHVRTQLATGDDETLELDPAALDDVKRAAAELRLAVPGVDWATIEKRTTGLVSAPLTRKKRNRLIVGALLAPFSIAVFAWVSALVPAKKQDRNAAMKHELADIAQQRRMKIVELQRELGEIRCDPPTVRELAKQLVMDGRGWDAKDLADRYKDKCGEDPVVMHWANAPHP